jgi:tetratricopeptide (TPR) repeat protein
MLKIAGACAALVLAAVAAMAGPAEDCAQVGDRDRSDRGCTELFRQNVTSVAPHTDRALTYMKQDNFESAIAEYTKAIDLDPSRAILYRLRGSAYQRKGDRDRAIVDYTKVIELSPKDPAAYILRGMVKSDIQNYMMDALVGVDSSKTNIDPAIADYAKAIELKPRDSTAYSLRGALYELKRDNKRAIADYRKAISINPADGISRDGLKRLGAAR